MGDFDPKTVLLWGPSGNIYPLELRPLVPKEEFQGGSFVGETLYSVSSTRDSTLVRMIGDAVVNHLFPGVRPFAWCRGNGKFFLAMDGEPKLRVPTKGTQS